MYSSSPALPASSVPTSSRRSTRRGVDRIIAVDNMTKADKFKNLVDCDIVDYIDKNSSSNC